MDPPVPNESWPSQQAEDESWTVPVDPSLDATSGSADFLAHIPQHSFTIAVRPHVRYKRNYPRLTGWDTFTNPETPTDSLLTTFVQHHAEQYVASHSFEMLDGDDHWDNIWTFLRAYHEVTCSPSTAAAAQSRMLSARATLLSRFVDLLRTDAHQLSATLQEAYMTSTGQLRCFVVSFVDEAPAIAVQGETPSYVWVDRGAMRMYGMSIAPSSHPTPTDCAVRYGTGPMTALSNVIAAGLGLSLVIFLLGVALSLIPDPAFSPSIPGDDPDSDPSSGDTIELRDLKPR